MKTIDRINIGIDLAINYLQHKDGHLDEAIAGLLDAQKLLEKLDNDSFNEGYEQARIEWQGACEQSYNLGYAQASGHAADDLQQTLYDLCSPGEGNLKP